MRRILRVLVLLTGFALAMLWGMFAQRDHLPPYGLVKWTFDRIAPPPGGGRLRPDPELVDRIDARHRLTDPATLLHARSSAELDELRSGLRTFLFGEDRLPALLPRLDETIPVPGLYGAPGRTWVVELATGLRSVVFDLQGRDDPRTVVLYHQGHGEGPEHSADFVRGLLGRGARVLVLAMPLEGRNPPLEIEQPVRMRVEQHAQLAWVPVGSGHPVRQLVEPVVVMLNELEAEGTLLPVTMVGLSGGGWTTTVAAAVDQRIGLSVPVAGSLPLWLRSDRRQDWGDWEQNLPELYGTWSYLDLYLLGATGAGRAQLQVLNRYDPVCFAGIRSELYAEVVAERVAALGPGAFRVFLDDSHAAHAISPAAQEVILDLVPGLGD